MERARPGEYARFILSDSSGTRVVPRNTQDTHLIHGSDKIDNSRTVRSNGIPPRSTHLKADIGDLCLALKNKRYPKEAHTAATISRSIASFER